MSKELKHESSICKQTRTARRRKAELIEQLGSKCVKCGTTEDLEFDHKNGRDYDPQKLSYSARLARYKREADRGEIRLLCGRCNKAARATNDNGAWIPTKDAAHVTRTTHMDFANDEDIPF